MLVRDSATAFLSKLQSSCVAFPNKIFEIRPTTLRRPLRLREVCSFRGTDISRSSWMSWSSNWCNCESHNIRSSDVMLLYDSNAECKLLVHSATEGFVGGSITITIVQKPRGIRACPVGWTNTPSCLKRSQDASPVRSTKVYSNKVMMSEGVEVLAPNDVVSQGLCALTVVFIDGSQGYDYVYVYTVVKHLTCLATTMGQR